jgi:hypothetical protein
MAAWLIVAGLLAASCGGVEVQAPSDAVAEDLHAATGHVEPECYVFGSVQPVLVIGPAGFDHECLVAGLEQSLVIENTTDQEATWWAVDLGSASPRKLRIEVVVPAGGSASVPRLGDLVDEGRYQMFLTERLATHRGFLEVAPAG